MPYFSSLTSKNSKEKHEKPRLCAGAKMFSDALRQIQTSRNGKSSRSPSISSNDGSLENKASFDLPDNLEITIQVASDQQKTINRKIAHSVQSENRLHPNNNVIEESICSTSKDSISSNDSLGFVPMSKDSSHQTFYTEYPSSNKEVKSQVSKLNDISLMNDKYLHSCETDSNSTFEVQANSEVENRPHQTKQSIQKDNNNNKINSLFWEKENDCNKSISMLKKKTNNIGISSDEDSSSLRYSPNDYEWDKTSAESRTIPKQHTLSLNELCTPKSLNIEREESFKPVFKSSSVNKSKYFIPQNFLGEIHDFPVHYSRDTSPFLFTQNVSKNCASDNSSQPTISPEQFYKNNVVHSNSGLSNDHKCSNGKAPTANTNCNYRKDFEFEESTARTSGKNNSLHYKAVSLESSVDSKITNDGKIYKKSNIETSKGHHVPLSEIFRPPQKIRYSFLENATNSSYDNLKYRQDLIQKDIATVNNEYSNTLSDENQSNNFENEKISLPSKKDFCSSNSVPLRFRNPSKYQNKFETHAPAVKGSVQHFGIGDVFNKLNLKPLKNYSGPVTEIDYPESHSSQSSLHKYVPLPLSSNYAVMNESVSVFNSKQRAIKVVEDSDSSTSSHSSLHKYVPLSSNYTVMKESVSRFNSKQRAMKVIEDSDSSTSSHSSLYKYMPLSSDCIIKNKKAVGTKLKKSSGHSLLLSEYSEEPQHLSDFASDSSTSGHEPQLCDNSYRQPTTKSISFQKYMKQQDLVIKCNTDFVVPSKFSYDSNGDLPLSSSVLEVVPDLLIGTCLVDHSD